MGTEAVRIVARPGADGEPGAPGLPALAFGPGQGLRRYRCRGESPRPGDCEVVLAQSAYRQVCEHLGSDTTRELGGLLLGSEVVGPDGRRAVLVLHALPAQCTEGTPVRLVFTEETWAAFDRTTDAFEATGLRLRRVGWYHSHPDIAIHLSKWDLNVCEVFARPTHLALVVDPVQGRGGFFVHGSAGYCPASPQGFVELCDLQAETVVRWRNVEEVSEPAVPPPVAVEQAPARRPLGLWAALALALAAGVAAAAGGWWRAQDLAAQLAAEAEEARAEKVEAERRGATALARAEGRATAARARAERGERANQDLRRRQQALERDAAERARVVKQALALLRQLEER
jgi:proteasome lid subunit RPN8/RPN11